MPADEMVDAIRGNDIARLTRIPGIGKKTAERMVLELRDKLAIEKHGEIAAAPALSAAEEDVLSALVNLGISGRSGEGAGIDLQKAGHFDAMFRQALAALSK